MAFKTENKTVKSCLKLILKLQYFILSATNFGNFLIVSL